MQCHHHLQKCYRKPSTIINSLRGGSVYQHHGYTVPVIHRRHVAHHQPKRRRTTEPAESNQDVDNVTNVDFGSNTSTPLTSQWTRESCNISLEDLYQAAHESATAKPTLEQAIRMRQLFDDALASPSDIVKRFAALFTIKESLRLSVGLQLPLAVKARTVVEELSDREDPEAMALNALVLEKAPLDHQMSEHLLKADELHEKVFDLVVAKRWPEGRRQEIIVSKGSAVYGHAMFKLAHDPAREEQALHGLALAAEKYGHYDACRELASRQGQLTTKRYELLLRLAVSGNAEAAKLLGDFCLTTALHEKKSVRQRRGLEEEAYEDITWADCPSEYHDEDNDSVPKSCYNNLDEKALTPSPYTPISRLLSVIRHATYYMRHIGSDREEAKKWIREARRDRLFVARQVYKWRQVPVDEKCWRLGTNDWRYYRVQSCWTKAIDWYKLAASRGHASAMVDGIVLAAKWGMPYDVEWFHFHIHQIYPNTLKDNPAERSKYLAMDGWIEGLRSKIWGQDRKLGTEVNMPRLIICS